MCNADPAPRATDLLVGDKRWRARWGEHVRVQRQTERVQAGNDRVRVEPRSRGEPERALGRRERVDSIAHGHTGAVQDLGTPSMVCHKANWKAAVSLKKHGGAMCVCVCV